MRTKHYEGFLFPDGGGYNNKKQIEKIINFSLSRIFTYQLFNNFHRFQNIFKYLNKRIKRKRNFQNKPCMAVDDLVLCIALQSMQPSNHHKISKQ